MPKNSPASRRRSILTFTVKEVDQLLVEAARRGLKLATYLRSLIATHPERASGAAKR